MILFFCCYTGLVFSDVKQLKALDIVVGSNGVKWIRKIRQKTKIMCKIPLRDILLRILEKYADDKLSLVHDVLLPVMYNQKMNACLKELGDICEINKMITTHLSRHTFATYALANGISMECVAMMLSHTNLQMTRHYARTLDRTIVKELF
ncbi:site-specific integrase [Bacteroides ovatus]|uniref:site-specific integrase n=1 Tax=Bacteroides ovatus TaxID=28116 RepID=UPI0032BF67DA